MISHQVSPGLFAAVPDDVVGHHWFPSLEATALAIALSEAGPATPR